MAHFTLQVGPLGPLLTAGIGVSEPKGVALKAANQPIPTVVAIRALVDTGASCTCVDPAIITQLGLVQTGTTQMLTPSTGAAAHTVRQFDVSLMIPGVIGAIPHIVPIVAVAETALRVQGIDALIGRDILNACLLHYNGTTGFFTLAF